MVFENIEFHNVAELEERPRMSGIWLQRFPKSIREALSPNGRCMAEESTGCEIRFVTPAERVCVTLSAVQVDGEVNVFCGDFHHSSHRLQKGIPTAIEVETPAGLASLHPDLRPLMNFAPNVWRLVTSRYTAVFHEINTFAEPLRPPTRQEKPQIRWLAYGSSITHATAPGGFIHQTARRCGMDVINLGLSGSCHCEKTIAEYIAKRDDFDFTVFELGINMRFLVEPDDFARRVHLLVERVRTLHPLKPIVLLGLFPNYASAGLALRSSRDSATEHAYNEILEEVAAKTAFATFIPGNSILSSACDLSCDLVHPSDFGHSIMAENLARILKALFPA